MDTLLSMRVFARVVDSGSFTEAARRLGLSPPMVTRHIQALEHRIGSRLIQRTTHQFSLTEAGAIYHEHCVQLLSDIEEAEGIVGSLGRLPQGRLRLSAPIDFGRVELWPIVREFMRLHPQVQVNLVLTNRLVDLIEEDFDLAIRVSEHPLEGTLIARKLATVLCGGVAGAAREVTEDEILELEREAFVSLCGEPKTQARMQHMLLHNKPLRN